MSQETDPLPSGQPTRELLVAQALETCINAEREVPGSADYIIAHQPAWARTELRRLVALAGSLDAVATSAVMSDDFRVGARARLMERIGGTTSDAEGDTLRLAPIPAWLAAVPSANGHHPHPRHPRSRRWLWRGATGGLLAAVLATAATLTASANALPGEPLYGIKQAQEELGLRLAPDDQTRALALLQQADARLDETARLLKAGRTDQVALTTQRYDEVVDRATTTYVVTIAESASEASATAHMETKLTQQQQQLQALLVTAPEPARPGLREALVATERGRALVADPQPVERALGRTRSNAAAALPTMAAETVPTVVVREAEPAPRTPASPPPADLVADRHDLDDQRPRQVEKVQSEDRGGASASTAAVARQGQAPRLSAPAQSDQQRGARPAASNRGPERLQQVEPAAVVVTHDGEGGDDREGDRTDLPSPGDGHASVPQLVTPLDKRIVAPTTTDEDTRGRVAGTGGQDNVAREAPSTSTSATTARSPQPPIVTQPAGTANSGDRADGGEDDRSVTNARNSTSGSNTRTSSTTTAPSTAGSTSVSATPTPAPERARTTTSLSGSTTTNSSTTTTTTTSSSGDRHGGTSGSDGGKIDGGHGATDDK